MSKDYAEQRASVLRDLDGLHYEVDAETQGRVSVARPAAAQRRVVSRPQSDRRDHGSVRPGPDVRVVVIRGNNGVYTSGGDVKAFPQIERDGMSHLAWNIAAPRALPEAGDLRRWRRYAMGVGLELAMACDIRLATKETVLALPEVTLGPNSRQRRQPAHRPHRRPHPRGRHDDARPPHPGAGGACLGPRHPRRRRQRRRSIRILDEMVETLTSMSPLALKTIKRVLNTAYDTSLSVGLRGRRPCLREAARERRLQGRHRRVQREA